MKKSIAILIAVLMVVSLAACGETSQPPPEPGTQSTPAAQSSPAAQSPPPSPPSETPAAQETPPVEDESPTFVITDMAGREVEIPRNPQSLCYTWGGVGSFIFVLGAQDRLTAVNMPNDLLRFVYPAIEDVGTVGRGRPDLEAIAALEPDIFFHRAADLETIESVQELGIPSVGVIAENHEDIVEFLSLLGVILGLEERAAEVIAIYSDTLERAMALVADIPEADKKTAIVMGSELGRVAHAEMIQSMLIEAAGGINSAAVDPEVTFTGDAWTTVGVEKVFAWDPDYIFVTNNWNNEYSVDDILSDRTWANLKSVREGNVIQVGSDMDSWEFPGVSIALGALWMVHTMYPERLSRAELETAVAEFYKALYDVDLTPEILGY